MELCCEINMYITTNENTQKINHMNWTNVALFFSIASRWKDQKPSQSVMELTTQQEILQTLSVRRINLYIISFDWLICVRLIFLADLASGNSIDWAYDKLNVPLAYTFEFRDQGICYTFKFEHLRFIRYQTLYRIITLGRHGFLLPADQIIPNSLEVIDGLFAMVKEAKALNYL